MIVFIWLSFSMLVDLGVYMIPVKTPVELIHSLYVWRVAKHYPNGDYLIIRGMQKIIKRRVTADMIKPWHTTKG